MSKKKGGAKATTNARPKRSVDIVTGTWTWDGSEVVTGEVTSNNAPYRTYFGLIEESGGDQPRFSGYAYSNRNGIYDAGLDLYVGSATLSPIATSAVFSGTWDANKKTGIANGYSGSNLVATADGIGFWFGDSKKAPKAPKKTKSSNGGSSSKDSITGSWTADFSGNITMQAKRGSQSLGIYFAQVTGGQGQTVFYSGFRDSNQNGIYDQGVDPQVGTGTANSLVTSPRFSGTFQTDGIAWKGFSGSTQVATGESIVSWFG